MKHVAGAQVELMFRAAVSSASAPSIVQVARNVNDLRGAPRSAPEVCLGEVCLGALSMGDSSEDRPTTLLRVLSYPPQVVTDLLAESESYGYAILKRVRALSEGESSGPTACSIRCCIASVGSDT